MRFGEWRFDAYLTIIKNRHLRFGDSRFDAYLAIFKKSFSYRQLKNQHRLWPCNPKSTHRIFDGATINDISQYLASDEAQITSLQIRQAYIRYITNSPFLVEGECKVEGERNVKGEDEVCR